MRRFALRVELLRTRQVFDPQGAPSGKSKKVRPLWWKCVGGNESLARETCLPGEAAAKDSLWVLTFVRFPCHNTHNPVETIPASSNLASFCSLPSHRGGGSCPRRRTHRECTAVVLVGGTRDNFLLTRLTSIHLSRRSLFDVRSGDFSLSHSHSKSVYPQQNLSYFPPPLIPHPLSLGVQFWFYLFLFCHSR